MKPVQAFKAALIAALKADAGITASVAGRVFDYVPPTGTPSPWLYVANIVGTKAVANCGHQWDLRVRIYVATTDFVHDAPLGIAEAAAALLDRQILPMPDGMQQTVEIEITSVGDVDDPQQPASTFLDLTATVAG